MSITSGQLNYVSGPYSGTFGYGIQNYGSYSTAGGYGHTIGVFGSASYGTYGVALGQANDVNTTTSINGIAIGKLVSADNTNTIAMGSGSGAKMINSTANSLGVGFNATAPTFIVTAAGGAGTYGRVGIANNSPAETLDVGGNILSSGSITGVSASWGGGYAGGSGGDLEATGNIVTTGNIGVGDSTPADARLDIKATGGSSDYMAINASGTVYIQTSGVEDNVLYVNETAADASADALFVKSASTSASAGYFNTTDAATTGSAIKAVIKSGYFFTGINNTSGNVNKIVIDSVGNVEKAGCEAQIMVNDSGSTSVVGTVVMSKLFTEGGDATNKLSQWVLDGVAFSKTTNGALYYAVANGASTATVKIYKTSSGTEEATCTVADKTIGGACAFTAVGGSGITGRVLVAANPDDDPLDAANILDGVIVNGIDVTTSATPTVAIGVVLDAVADGAAVSVCTSGVTDTLVDASEYAQKGYFAIITDATAGRIFPSAVPVIGETIGSFVESCQPNSDETCKININIR
jgi:hypothetical protein